MRAGRVARQTDAHRVAAITGEVPEGPFNGGDSRIRHAVQRRAGTELIVGDDGCDAAGDERGGEEGKVLLVLRAPVPAVEEDVDRRWTNGPGGRIDIDAPQRVVSVG